MQFDFPDEKATKMISESITINIVKQYAQKFMKLRKEFDGGTFAKKQKNKFKLKKQELNDQFKKKIEQAKGHMNTV